MFHLKCFDLRLPIILGLKLRSSRAESNWPLRSTVGQNSSSVQMAFAYHVGAAIFAHVARRGQLDSALDEGSLKVCSNEAKKIADFRTDISLDD